jgi:hypothetical protein
MRQTTVDTKQSEARAASDVQEAVAVAQELARRTPCLGSMPCGRLTWKQCESILGDIRTGKEGLTPALCEWVKHVAVVHSRVPRAVMPSTVAVQKSKIYLDGQPLAMTSLCKGGLGAAHL